MLTAHACVPCFARHIIDSVARLTPAGDPRGDQLLRSCLRVLAEADYHRPPPAIAQDIQRHLRRLSACDPFQDIKRESCALALSLLPGLQEQVAAADDPFGLAIRFAAAGNLIDAGLVQDLGRLAVEQALEESRAADLDSEHLKELRRRINEAERILYLADNAGELVFDRLLLEQLPLERLTLVVRGAAVLNDVTREDVAMSAVSESIAVIDNGSDAPGTILSDCSREMQEAFLRADLVISKGQGNFETLHEEAKPIFFILKAKCQVVAEMLGVVQGSIVARFMARPE